MTINHEEYSNYKKHIFAEKVTKKLEVINLSVISYNFSDFL